MSSNDVTGFREFTEKAVDRQLEKMDSRLKELQQRKGQRMQYLEQFDPDRLSGGGFRKLTILHSNDLHGDFLSEEVDSCLIGGVSMLSGY